MAGINKFLLLFFAVKIVDKRLFVLKEACSRIVIYATLS